MVSYKKPKPLATKGQPDKIENYSLIGELMKLKSDYLAKTEPRLKLIDCYMAIVLLMGIMLFLYCIIFMPKPFHIFLSAFISCVACFVFGASLRMQIDPNSEKSFPEITHKKAIFDFVLANIITHAVVINYIG